MSKLTEAQKRAADLEQALRVVMDVTRDAALAPASRLQQIAGICRMHGCDGTSTLNTPVHHGDLKGEQA